MANLNVHNYRNLKMRINRDDYWDFFVSKDALDYCEASFKSDGKMFYEDGLVSFIDLSYDECHDDEWIYGTSNYTWEDSVSLGYNLYNISYVGIDNGLFTYRKDRISNKDFVELFQNNKYEIKENDFRLKLHKVSGNTLEYEYPISFENDSVKLNGGFFQGFFKTECDKYQVFPSRFNDGDAYTLEFTLKKCDLEAESAKTLNSKYPNNKGIFFYIGTRAENKWIYLYDKDDIDGLEECSELGVDDFVEDGEIDKKDYIINNFNDPNPSFEGYDPFELGDYTNYNYYDNKTYEEGDFCDWDDMFDYADMEKPQKNGLIDENKAHETLSWCCGENSEGVEEKTILTPFFRGCGCPISYKVKKEGVITTTNGIETCSEFGEDYIGDWDDIMGLDDAVDYIESELDISDFTYETDNGFDFGQANQYYFYTDNKFLMFDRTKNGKTVSTWVEGTQFMYYGIKNNFKGNLFILMNRTKTGYTVNTINELREKDNNYYNPYDDIYDNALAFRITDDGEIGYRLLTVDCEKEGRNKTKILEGYSNKGIIKDCEWFTVDVKLLFVNSNKMKLMFYVNGKLVYVTSQLPRIRLRALNDLYEKQEGVPYNISIGGGTQGLAETIQYNYMLNPTRLYPLEENFGGTFIGYFKSFKFYNSSLEQAILENNMKYENNRLRATVI